VPNGKVTTDEQRIGKDWEGTGRGLIWVLSQNFPGWTQENHETTRTGDMPAEIRTDNPLNTNLERHHYTKLFGHTILFRQRSSPE
jgi:hypothetical protein